MRKELSTDLKSRIADHHAKAQAAAETAIAHALEAGKLLVKAKNGCRHGEWLPFLESVDINQRTVQRYMRLAKNEHVLKSDSMSHLSVTQSLEFLSSKKPEPVKIVGGPPLIDFGISGLSKEAQLTTILEDGSILFITPSSKHQGYYFVEKLHGSSNQVEGWRRPLREDAVVCCLEVLNVTSSLWRMDKKKTDEPLFMDTSRDDSTRYAVVMEMGLMPAAEAN